jgi:hypothetical protein
VTASDEQKRRLALFAELGLSLRVGVFFPSMGFPANPDPDDAQPASRAENRAEQAERDPRDDKERWRLAWHYAEMSDAELDSLAADFDSLTDVARRALQSELSKRGLTADRDRTFAAASAAAAKPARTRKLVIVCRFRDMPEALLAKSVLESAGVECLLDDANIIRTDWLWSNLVGGVKLRVLEENREEAARLLGLDPSAAPDQQGVARAGDAQQLRCPRCHSPEVSLDDLRQPEPAAGFSALAPARRHDPLWTCQSCGNQRDELEPTG